ncbi:MAG: hypothetical protein ACXABE_05040 [Candidatus Thorarchaeota archaeon]|jgi:hypothetical protein
MIDRLESTGAQRHLLPNEEVRFACQIRNGFLVFSDRRIVILKQKGRLGYSIDRAIPYDFVIGFAPKKDDRMIVSGSRPTKEPVSIELKIPNRDSVLLRSNEVIEENNPSPQLDYSYLEHLPDSLTNNVILDLNTVLRDQPIHDELVNEAKKFLGDEPFLLEDSLRAGENNTNGVLFAAGTLGYYWVQGKKSGRFLTNVIIDTVEWTHIKSVSHQWHKSDGIIDVTYSLTQNGRANTVQYQWCLPINNDTLNYHWLLEPLNGPWILADVAYRCSGSPLPATQIYN